ncbi:MAG: protoheme IX farnesyltransferase [Burkholderiales bacterium]|nr:protoheme IX farnesyltransferase [Burkholderiales bacterium]
MGSLTHAASAGTEQRKPGHRAAAALRTIGGLFKLRIGLVIGFTALAGLAMTPGPALGGWRVAMLGLAVVISAAAAGGFNQWYERDLDARMRRTMNRPFVTGELAQDWRFPALLAALIVAATATAAFAANWLAALYTFLGAFFYAIVYTVWLKRRTWWNIVIGGLAGSFAVLAGAAAVVPDGLPAVPLVLAVVLFLWTPPHFWSLAMVCRDDYQAAGVPMLPVVVGDRACAFAILLHTIALVALSFVPLAYGMGWIYGIGAAAGGGLFVLMSLRLLAQPTRKRALGNFTASLAQLTVLLSAGIVDAALAG